MKQTILVVLTVLMVATSCFAQGIEPDGMFSIEGTEWQSLPIGMWVVSVFPIPMFGPIKFSIGFDDGTIYPSDSFTYESFYLDLLAVSIFRYKAIRRNVTTVDEITGFGILQPIGVGVMIVYERPSGFVPFLGVMILIKIDDNWTPPPE